MSTTLDVTRLTRNQARAIPALLQSRTLTDAAKSIGVTRRTLGRWLGQPEFVEALRSAQGEAIDLAYKRVLDGQGPDSATWIDVVLWLHELSRFGERIRRLERRLDELEK